MATLRHSSQPSDATRQRVDAWMALLAPSEEPATTNTHAALSAVLGRIEMARAFKPLPREIAWRPRYLALALHGVAFAVLMFGFTSPNVQEKIRQRITVFNANLRPYIPKQTAGGGGGGAREQEPVTKGQAPKPSLRQFTPPMIVQQAPKLEIMPSIIAPPDEVVPQNNLATWGDPLARLINGSNGSGSNGGMGSGCCGGVGPGHGGGYGIGDLGGLGGVYSVGGAVSRPIVLSKVDPEYSEDARKARFSGTVTLEVVVDTEGRVRGIKVVKSLGMGLDEKAVEAVSKWKFKPGMKGGQPVNVRAEILVSFHLL